MRLALLAAALLVTAGASPAADAARTLASGPQTPAVASTVSGFPQLANGVQATWSWSANRTSGTVTVQGTPLQQTYPTVLYFNATSASALWVRIDANGGLVNPASSANLEVSLVTAATGSDGVLQVKAVNGAYTQSQGTAVQVPAGGWLKVQVKEQRQPLASQAPSAALRVHVHDTAGQTRGGSLALTLVA